MDDYIDTRKSKNETHLNTIPTGTQIESWVILEDPAYRKIGSGYHLAVKCRCACGVVKFVRLANLLRGGSKRCKSCAGSLARTTHGARQTRLYQSWCNMKVRCKPSYWQSHLYYHRGISTCAAWQDSFEAFREWALANGYRDDLTLDRWPDNNGNYEPSNCRWADHQMQSRNRRSNRLVTAFGETKPLAEWTEDSRCVVGHRTLRNRLEQGLRPEDAMCMSAGTGNARAGMARRGSANPNAKLNAERVREIRTLSSNGMSKGEIARQAGVSETTVSAILLRKTWKWLSTQKEQQDSGHSGP